jgi:hypothetical protein
MENLSKQQQAEDSLPSSPLTGHSHSNDLQIRSGPPPGITPETETVKPLQTTGITLTKKNYFASKEPNFSFVC